MKQLVHGFMCKRLVLVKEILYFQHFFHAQTFIKSRRISSKMWRKYIKMVHDCSNILLLVLIFILLLVMAVIPTQTFRTSSLL